MKHSQKEIIQALKVISDECQFAKHCENCPFRKNLSDCYINEESPENWTINEENDWKAFE